MVAQRAGVTPRVGPRGERLRAAGAVRVSEGKQGLGYSPQTQRQAILARACADGYLMDPEDIYEDHERGHKLGRKGYVAILKGVREGRYSAVYVFMLDRWGRDSIERQQRGKEFDRLGVPLISVTEGVDEPGLVRVIRAELAEEESRKNAARVTPNRERAAREGTHMGSTPYGYVRMYPEWDGKGRRPAGLLVPHEPEASVVRWLFASYASGQWSTAQLAADLNARRVEPPRPKRQRPAAGEQPQWRNSAIRDILSNATYTGVVTYNRTPTGHYQRADPGSAFTAEGKHAALVEPATFALVQRRLGQARTYTSVARRKHTHLLAGLLRCASCRGLMVPMLPLAGSTGHGALRCADRHHGAGGCTGSGYRLDLAEQALLDQVRRVRGSPWTTEKELLLAGQDGAAAAALDRALEEARETLKQATRRFMVEIKEPTDLDREMFEAVRCEQGARICALEQLQAQLKHDAQALPRLRKLHERLTSREIGSQIDQRLALGDIVGLRDLLVELVESATLVERYPAMRSRWLRLEVTWTEDVALLVRAGLLAFGPAPEPPVQRSAPR